MEAARALGRTGQKESKVIAALAAALKDEDAAVRLKAVASLFELNEQATAQRPVVLPSLIEALRDKNEEVQAGAAILIGKFGQDAREAVPDLMTLLKAAHVKARQNATYALAVIGPDARPALPIFLDLAKNDADVGVRTNALLAIGRIGPEASSAVPFLIENIQSEDVARQWGAALALYHIGPDARAAIPALTKLLERDSLDQQVRQAATTVIASLNGKKPTSRESLPPMGTGAMNEQQMLQMKRMRLGPGKNP